MCQSPSDFAKGKARLLIWQTCHAFLDEKKACPLELLHSKDLQAAFQNAGGLQATAVQKIAIAQVKGSGLNVQDRIKQLNAIIDTYITTCWNAHKEDKIPPLNTESDDLGLGKLLAAEKTFENSFLVYAALTKHLTPLKQVSDKIETLLALYANVTNESLQKILDQFISDYLPNHTIWKSTFESIESTAKKVDILKKLTEGRIDDIEQNFSNKPLFHQIINLKLKRCSLAFRDELKSALETRNKIFSKDLYAEVSQTLKMQKSFTSKEDPTKNQDIINLLQERLNRYLEYEMLYKYISELAFYIERIQVLVEFFDVVQDVRDKKHYRELLNTYIDRWDLVEDLANIDMPSKEKIELVGRLYLALQKSNLPENIMSGYRDKIKMAINNT